MSGYSFLTVVLVDLLLVNQAHLYKLPIFAKEEPGRIKFNFSPNLAGSGPAQPSSGTAHVQMPSALVNLSYEGDNTCTGVLISQEMVLTAVACLYYNQTLFDLNPRFGMHIDLTDKKNVYQKPCSVKGNFRESTMCFWVHI